MSELKNCPFCGNVPQITYEKRLVSLQFNKNYPNNGKDLYLERDTYFAECNCCKLLKSWGTEEEAITAWNTRVGCEAIIKGGTEPND